MSDPIEQRIKVTTGDLVGAVRTGAATLSAYLLGCVVATTLVVLFADDPGTPLDWARYGVLVAALGLHGKAFTRYDDDSGVSDGASIDFHSESLSFSYGFVPLLALALAVLLAYFFARRGEQLRPSSSQRHAAVRSVLSAVVATALLCVVARLSRLDEGVGLGDAEDGAGSAGAAIAPLLLWGVPILSLAFVAGHLATHRLGKPSLWQALSERTWGIAPWAGSAALHAALTAGLLTVAGIVYGLLTSDEEIREATDGATSSDVGRLLVALLLLPNIALAATGFFLGFSVSGGGIAAGSGGDQSYGLLHGSTPTATYLWCLAPVVAAVVVGVRHELRRPTSGSLLAGWWQAGLGWLVVWVPLSLLLRVSISSSGFGFGDFGIGFTAFTVLALGFGWGVLALVLGRRLAGPVARSFPRVVARVTPVVVPPAPTGEPVEPHGPMPTNAEILASPSRVTRTVLPTIAARPPRHFRPRTLAIIGAVGAVILIAGGTYTVLDRQRYGPTATAEAYLTALSEGHVSEALSHARLDGIDNRTLLTDEALPAGKRIQGPRVTKVRREGAMARVTVTYRLGGRRETDQLTLRQKGRRAGLFHDWEVVGAVTELQLASFGELDTVLVNGIEVTDTDTFSSLPALPGLYDVGVPAQSLFMAESQTARVTFRGSDNPLQVRLELSDAAIQKAQDAAIAYLTGCLAKATTLETACGFTSYAFADRVEGLRWSLVGRPELDVTYDATTGSVRVDSRGSVEARVTGTAVRDDIFGGSATREKLDETATTYVYGLVDLSGSTPVFTPSR